MNNHEREERRKLHERRDDEALAKSMPEINRAHRDCERECMDLKVRISALESLLAVCGDLFEVYLSGVILSKSFVKLTADKIDAILPATEGKKYDAS